MYLCILLALVASAAANVYVNGPCPTVKTVDNFQFETFGQGKWYEYARYPNSLEEGGICSYSEYTLGSGQFTIRDHDYLDGQLRVVSGVAKLAPGETSKLIYSYPYGPNRRILQYVFNVLATDNKNYVVGYYCKFNEHKGTRQDFAWVMSRSKTLSKEAELAVENALGREEFLDKKKFVKIDYSHELCQNI